MAGGLEADSVAGWAAATEEEKGAEGETEEGEGTVVVAVTDTEPC